MVHCVDAPDALGLVAVDGVHNCLIVGLPFLAAHKSFLDVLIQLLNTREVVGHAADDSPLPMRNVVGDGVAKMGLIRHLLYVEHEHLEELLQSKILRILTMFGQNAGPVRGCSSLETAREVVENFPLVCTSLFIHLPVDDAQRLELWDGELQRPFSSLRSLVGDDLKILFAFACCGRHAFDFDMLEC